MSSIIIKQISFLLFN